jgi:hypothetical protein
MSNASERLITAEGIPSKRGVPTLSFDLIKRMPRKELVLAIVILLLTTFPGLYISWLSLKFIVTGHSSLAAPGPIIKAVFTFSTIKSDIFNLFNLIALPSLTAYYASSGEKDKENISSWIIFLYLILVFVLSYMPEILSENSEWKKSLSGISIDTGGVTKYIETVRNSALAAMSVMAGIKLANVEQGEA